MICKQLKKDCMFFAYSGHCTILRDTFFTRPCPFYKRGLCEEVLERTFPDRAERFRSISGTEGKYFVSEMGVVFSRRGYALARKHDKNGKPIVTLALKDGRSTTRSVAILVADAFLPGAGRVEVIDGDPDNCELWNLRRIDDGKQNI